MGGRKPRPGGSSTAVACLARPRQREQSPL